MFTKLAFSALFAFGLYSFADDTSMQMASSMPIQEVTEMAEIADDVGGFNGSVELKYKYNSSSEDNEAGEVKYRARAGWTGTVNQDIKWGIGVSSNIEENFDGYHLKNLWLEQVYAKYTPVEGFWIKVGKSQKKTNHHWSGVLHDDDLYEEGVSAKFHTDFGDTKFYVKAAVVNNAGGDAEQGGGHADFSGPFNAGWHINGKTGVKSDLDVATVHAGIGIQNDAIAEGDKTYGSVHVSALVQMMWQTAALEPVCLS